jgi:hypothetical protein
MCSSCLVLDEDAIKITYRKIVDVGPWAVIDVSMEPNRYVCRAKQHDADWPSRIEHSIVLIAFSDPDEA